MSVENDLAIVRASLETLAPNEDIANELARKFGLTERHERSDGLAALGRLTARIESVAELHG